MGPLAIAAVALVLSNAQDAETPEDRWVVSTPSHETADPCGGEAGPDGASPAWVNAVMLERGHPRALICAGGAIDSSAIEAREDLLDLTAQASARVAVLIGGVSRSLDDDRSWGEQSETAARSIYMTLKADDYRLLRQTAAEETAATP